MSIPELDVLAQNLCQELDIAGGSPLDIDSLLDLTRDAAHKVMRPAAPVTAFLAGYAAGMNGGGSSSVKDALATASNYLATLEGPAE